MRTSPARTTGTLPERSCAVAVWLLVVAALVFAMVLVGGLTRLTDSGLSITQWRPVTGALPPLSDAHWQAEFARYQQIPQYREVNAGMSLAEFQTIYWWEWAHRFLGRIVGAVFLLPFLAFLATRRLPLRLIWPCVGLFVLGGLQGLVGWWMVASGLADRISVAPERLAVHLGLALFLLCALLWVALDAWTGLAREPTDRNAWRGPAALLGLAFVQCLLGALVAGGDAGRIFTDWPLMGGELLPDSYAGADLWATLAHSPGAVQLHHRLGGYLLFAVAILFAWRQLRSKRSAIRAEATVLAALVVAQAVLGVVTLMQAAPLNLSLAHQVGAVAVLAAGTVMLWRSRRDRTVTAPVLDAGGASVSLRPA